MSTPPLYSALPVQPRSPDEPIHCAGEPLGACVGDFWRWYASDLAGNALRGVLAEYLVARAVGAPSAVRMEWDACDVVSPTGVRIEVKSAAFLQSWAQHRLSAIGFDVGRRLPWFAETATYGAERCRTADVYVFALLHEKEKSRLDPLDVAQWTFFVLPRLVLDETCGEKKRIGLTALGAMKATETDYRGLVAAIEAASGRPVVHASTSVQPVT